MCQVKYNQMPFISGGFSYAWSMINWQSPSNIINKHINMRGTYLNTKNWRSVCLCEWVRNAISSSLKVFLESLVCSIDNLWSLIQSTLTQTKPTSSHNQRRVSGISQQDCIRFSSLETLNMWLHFIELYKARFVYWEIHARFKRYVGYTPPIVTHDERSE